MLINQVSGVGRHIRRSKLENNKPIVPSLRPRHNPEMVSDSNSPRRRKESDCGDRLETVNSFSEIMCLQGLGV